MTLAIRLLGVPRLERDGEEVAGPRGRKAWALLAYLLLCRRSPSRARLAELLFSEANDPLRALRWGLAELRRALGEPEACRGDPLELNLPPSTRVDLHLLSAPGSAGEEQLEELGELLEGMTFSSSPPLEAWLLIERRHLAAATEALLRERALADLGAGRAESAARLARRLVEVNPFEEHHHELLVRSLLAAGDRRAAEDRVEACRELFRRELGAEPPASLAALVRAAPSSGAGRAVGGAAAARGKLDAGLAALAAGAVEAGLESLRAASELAAGCGDERLHARALLSLGSRLIHAMRGHGEGAAVLHRSVQAARRAGARDLAATAYRELAFVDVQAGRRERAEAWLERAVEAAGGSNEELAAILGVRGMNLCDAARYQEAILCFEESIERAHRAGKRRQEAWSRALAGRAQLLSERPAEARRSLDGALARVEQDQWIAFLPLPEVLLAHLDLQEGRVGEAAERLEHAFTISCQLGDPCWEGLAARGLGLLEAERGRAAQSLAWLEDARSRCTRVAHPYQWAHGWILEAMCSAALEQGDERASGWSEELAALAARTEMRELVLRAYLFRARLGDPAAEEAARVLAADLEAPIPAT